MLPLLSRSLCRLIISFYLSFESQPHIIAWSHVRMYACTHIACLEWLKDVFILTSSITPL